MTVPAPALAAFLATLEQERDLPDFVEGVRAVTRATHDTVSSIDLLARALGEDPRLSGRILRVANSSMYARAGRPVTDLRHAIMLVGFDRVRDLAVGASVFEHLQRRSPALRDLLFGALVAANQALQFAHLVGYVRPEEAYLAGLFRNLGEVIVAYHAPERHAALRERLRRDGVMRAQAEAAEFGFELDELGRAMGRAWALPAAVVEAMHRPVPGAADAPQTAARQLGLLTQLSADLVDGTYLREGHEAQATLRAAVDRYAVPLKLGEARLRTAARVALDDARHTVNAADVPFDHATLKRRLAETELLLERHGAPPSAARPGAAPPAREHAETLDAAVESALSALLAAGFTRAFFGLLTPDRSTLRGRLAQPAGGADPSRFVVPLGPGRGDLSAAVAAGADVVEADVAASAWGGERLVRQLRSGSFVLLPVVVGGQLLGALYADAPHADARAPAAVAAACGAIRDDLAAFLARHR